MLGLRNYFYLWEYSTYGSSTYTKSTVIDYILGMEAAVKETFSLFLCGDVMLGRGIDMIQEHSCDPVLYEGTGHVVAYKLHNLIIY